MPQLDISTYPSLIFWLFISFGLVYVSLSYFFLPKLKKTFQERQEKITFHKSEIGFLLENIDNAERKAEKKLHDARLMSEKMLEKEQKNLQQAFDEKKRTWKLLVHKKQEEISLALKKQQKKFLEDFQSEVPGLTTLVVDKLTGVTTEKK